MIENVIFVEDGSVDTDELIDSLSEKTRVIIYRQGANPPKIQVLEKPIETSYEAILKREATEEEVRKETAKEILQALYDEASRSSDGLIELTAHYIKNGLAKEYGVEVK